MTDKKLKAFEVRDNDEGRCVIAFSSNGATARREGGSELGLEFDEVESCRRAPWADEYAPGPVPMHAYLANGWWFECDHCGIGFDDEGRHGEDDDYREDEFQPVEDGEAHYCSPTCKMEYWAELRDRKARKCAAIEAALIRWPMATGVTAHRMAKKQPRQDEKAFRASFKLHGLKYPVEWVPGEETVTVYCADVEEFKRLYGLKDAA